MGCVGVSSVWATSVAFCAENFSHQQHQYQIQERFYLVSLVGSSGSDFALLTRREFGEIAVVVTLPTEFVSKRLMFFKPTVKHTSCDKRPWTLPIPPWG